MKWNGTRRHVKCRSHARARCARNNPAVKSGRRQVEQIFARYFGSGMHHTINRAEAHAKNKSKNSHRTTSGLPRFGRSKQSAAVQIAKKQMFGLGSGYEQVIGKSMTRSNPLHKHFATSLGHLPFSSCSDTGPMAYRATRRRESESRTFLALHFRAICELVDYCNLESDCHRG